MSADKKSWDRGPFRSGDNGIYGSAVDANGHRVGAPTLNEMVAEIKRLGDALDEMTKAYQGACAKLYVSEAERERLQYLWEHVPVDLEQYKQDVVLGVLVRKYYDSKGQMPPVLKFAEGRHTLPGDMTHYLEFDSLDLAVMEALKNGNEKT